MSDETIREKQYDSDWIGHGRLHESINDRLGKLETFKDEVVKLWSDQLMEMRNIKWLVFIIATACAPRLWELLKLVWH